MRLRQSITDAPIGGLLYEEPQSFDGFPRWELLGMFCVGFLLPLVASGALPEVIPAQPRQILLNVPPPCLHRGSQRIRRRVAGTGACGTESGTGPILTRRTEGRGQGESKLLAHHRFGFPLRSCSAALLART